jgi:hypothetical protein
LEGLSCLEWDRNFPAMGIEPQYITGYMKIDQNKQNSIMSSSDNILPGTFGPNAYSKPATGLNILRETIMGRELFDYAFKTYCERWKFKHPSPADFFRSMEDASAVDLDWFWRGWFYGTDPVDISIDDVKWYQLNTQNPQTEKGVKKTENESKDVHIGVERNKLSIQQTVNEKDNLIDDFYAKRNLYFVDTIDKIEYTAFLNKIDKSDLEFLNSNKQFYEIGFKNIGGLVMPLIIEFTFVDDSKEVVRIPAEIWRMYEDQVSKIFIFDKLVKSIRLDPFLETGDTDLLNNSWPQTAIPSRFQLFKQQQSVRENPMQRNKRVDELNKN